LFAVIIIRSYFTYISLGSIETHLCCGGVYSNRVIANCPQIVSVKKLVKIWTKVKCHVF